MTLARIPVPTLVGHAVRYPKSSLNAYSIFDSMRSSMWSMASQAASRSRPLRIDCSRSWSSSLTMRLTASRSSNATPRGPSRTPASSRLMSWRSTRNCRSTAASEATLTYTSGADRSSPAMASRSRASVSAFWCGVARVVNGTPARLRARRMRVETTTSDSGPVPRSHSPRREVRVLRFMVGPQRPDLVAEPRRVLISLACHGRFQPRLQLGLPGDAHPPGVPPRHLARVSGCAILHPLQERFQERPEGVVVVRAAEPTLGPEMGVRCATFRAHQVRRGRLRRHRQLAENELKQCRDIQFLGLGRDQVLLTRAGLAQVHFALLLLDDVRQVNGGRV